MAFDFPNTPTLGQVFGNYTWDGEKWQLQGSTVNAVRYDIAQALTEPQKVQARQNIYAAPLDALAYNGMQVNGSLEVNQERVINTGYVTGSGANFGDIWAFARVGTSAITIGVYDAGVFPGFNKAAAFTVTTAQAVMGATDYVLCDQRIEGYRIARLWWGTVNAQPITIGFWTAHARAGLYTGAVRNNANTRSYPFSYNQAVANAGEYHVVTIPGCTDGVWETTNNIGMTVTFAMAVGSTYTAPSLNNWLANVYMAGPGQVNGVAATSDVFRITGLIVLPGIEAPSAARSPLIMRPYDQELLLCQRYWEKSYDYGTAPGATGNRPGFVVMYLASTASMTNLAATVSFKTRKRALPAVTSYAPGSGLAGKVADFGNAVDVAAALAGISDNGFYNNPAASAAVPALNMGFHWVADARL